MSVLVVLESATPQQLTAIADGIATISKNLPTAPFVVTRSDLETSTDVFPIRYRNLQDDYDVLAGEDVLKDLTFDREHLRLRCEQELSNVLIRLRNRYLANRHPKAMKQTLQRAACAFLIALRTAIELETGLAADDLDGILSDATTATGLKKEGLDAIKLAASGLSSDEQSEVDRVFSLFVDVAEQAVRFVDQMNVSVGGQA